MVWVIRHFMRSISRKQKKSKCSWLEETTSSVLISEDHQSGRFLDLGLKTSLDHKTRTGSGNPMNFLWLAGWIFLGMALGALMNFLSGWGARRGKGCSYMICCGDFFWCSYPVTQSQLARPQKKGSRTSQWCQVWSIRGKLEMLPTNKMHKWQETVSKEEKNFEVRDHDTVQQTTRLCYSFYWNVVFVPCDLSRFYER